MDDDRVREIQLAAGASESVRLARDSVILVRRGRVVLRPPMEWLAENVIRPEVRLEQDETYTAVAGGWADLIAQGSAEVMLVSGLSNRLPPCRRLLRLLSRIFGSVRYQSLDPGNLSSHRRGRREGLQSEGM